uniref:Uncharacterized protein n=1 Tax=Anguilla anguilla TaxID=7936 RepID=A0A0E9W2J3_ANGAN
MTVGLPHTLDLYSKHCKVN